VDCICVVSGWRRLLHGANSEHPADAISPDRPGNGPPAGGLLIAGAILWIEAANGFKAPDFGQFPDRILSIPLIVTMVGIVLLFLPLWTVPNARRTAYAITTDRAIVADGRLSGLVTLQSFPASRLGAAKLASRSDGSGDILLATVLVPGKGRRGPSRRQVGFFGLMDAPIAYATLQEVAKDVPQEQPPPLPKIEATQRVVAPLFLIAMGGFFLVMGLTDLLAARRSVNWPIASATILQSTLVRHAGRSTTYRAQVLYRFQVGDRIYRGTQVSYGDHLSSRSHAEQILSRNPRGAEVPVSYDPQNPEKAVLQPGVAPFAWLYPGLGTFLVLLGGVLLLYSPGKKFD
jgi:Protein of unknown function (DUF3592)